MNHTKGRHSVSRGMGRSFLVCLAGLALSLLPPLMAHAGTIYTDASATGANNGTSWLNAYTDLQDALGVAGSDDQIWVAKGIYTPGTVQTASFQLKNEVGLYGGYPTGGGQRDWANNETILSGDIGTLGVNTDNCYHVATGSGTGVLDGFTVSGGYAHSGGVNDYGGGMYNDAGSPTVQNCTFSGNGALYGAGMYNHAGSPTVTNCVFRDNAAGYIGGMYNYNSSPTVTNCTFSGNDGGMQCGGMYNRESSNTTVTNCTFSGNTTIGWAGGMCNLKSSNITVTNCTFSGNVASDGGGIYNKDSTLTLENCTLSGNRANQYGGGIYEEPVGCFGARVRVLMADGSYRPIVSVRTGDAVLGYDFSRQTRVVNVVQGAWRVDASWYLEINGLEVTASHPFALGLDRWVRAGDLTIGDQVLGDNLTQITHAVRVDAPLAVHNLSVSGTHTFYVSNGRGDFLVHNKSTHMNGVTITDNTAGTAGGGIYVETLGAVELKNPLIADNTATTDPDCSGNLTSYGYNLIENTTGWTISGDTTGNLTGLDPKLGPLADNGGPTETCALLAGSPAIDAGSCTDISGNPVSYDQRGVARPFGSNCDIGAYEATFGDLNSDGAIDLLDVRLCAQIATGYIIGTAQQRAAADVDSDGDVDADDVTILSEYILGMRTTLP